jgi:PKD repeat protein
LDLAASSAITLTQRNGGLNQSGRVLAVTFPGNPHLGDAVVATFFWYGSTNIVDSVTDRLTDGTRVGNAYTPVAYFTAGPISMATYVATNVRNFPDTSTSRRLVVQANLSTSVVDGGVAASAYSGVATTTAQAVGAARSDSGSGTSTTIARPGPITAAAGALVYGVTLSNGFVGLDAPPSPFANIVTASDTSPLKADAEYAVLANGGTVEPQWTWYFNSPGAPKKWLATAFALNPPGSPPPGAPGNLTATATTTGSGLDPDGYRVTVDQTTSQPIATNGGSVTFTGLAPGSHTAVLSGVASNCTVSGGNARTVTVPSGGTATVSFSVTCVAAVSGGVIALDRRIGTLNESGRLLIKGFNTINPHRGDAIIATFFWVGATNVNVIDSVTDVLTLPGYPRVGNRYRLVEYSSAGGISMATYVATNVQNFPDGYSNPRQDSILAVRADLSTSVVDGGIMLSAWTGVASVDVQALGAHRSASGSGTTTTVADPGAIALDAGALAYGVTMSNGLVGLDRPLAPYANITDMSDGSMRVSGDYVVSSAAGSANPQWTWYFNSPGSPRTWLATVLALKPPAATPPPPPTANFTFSCTALTCTFDASSSTAQATATYSWIWGDATPAGSGTTATHSYATAGTRNVALTVSDGGGSSTATQAVTTVAPPVASFTFSCTGLACSFDASSSTAQATATYSWIWGDATPAGSGTTATHSYATAGTRNVTLTVSDGGGSSTATQAVTTVAPPVASFTFSCTGLACSFDASGSTAQAAATYSWNWGDGTAAGAGRTATHSYATAGTRSVILTVTDAGGSNSQTQAVTTVAPPVASFTFSCTGLACSFDASSSTAQAAATYSWNWGDGTAAGAGRTATHSYATGGTRSVILTVSDAGGSSTATQAVTTVAPPVANFTFSCTGLACTFDASSSTAQVTATFGWNWGDGTAAGAGRTATHSYATGGTRSVILTVTDAGGSSTRTQSVTVTAPNTPPVVSAGPNETAVTGLLYTLSASFTDATANGPWSYTISWGDGSTSSGTRTIQGAFTAGHTYITILPRSYTITVRVTDAAGASGSASKVVTVLLL